MRFELGEAGIDAAVNAVPTLIECFPLAIYLFREDRIDHVVVLRGCRIRVSDYMQRCVIIGKLYKFACL